MSCRNIVTLIIGADHPEIQKFFLRQDINETKELA
jgi:hypothetical protein